MHPQQKLSKRTWMTLFLVISLFAFPSRARAGSLLDALRQDIAGLGSLADRNAAVVIRVIDGTGQGIDPDAISGPLHAALVMNSSFGWSGSRWLFLTEVRSAPGTELDALALLINGTPKLTSTVLSAIGGKLPRQTVAVIMYVLVLPGGELEYFLLGAYRRSQGRTVPVLRVFSGNVERGSTEILSLCVAAQN